MRVSSRIRLSDDEFAALLAKGVGAAIFDEIKRHPLPESPPWAEPSGMFWGIGQTEIGAVAVEAVLVHLAVEHRRRRTSSRLWRMASLLRVRYPRMFPAWAGFFADRP